MIAEEIIRQEKYASKLKNLCLICDAMDEFAEALIKENTELKYVLKLALDCLEQGEYWCNKPEHTIKKIKDAIK